jgi:hypothetical protein
MAPILKEIDPLASGLFIWQPLLGPTPAGAATVLGSIRLTGQADKFVILLNKKKNLEVRIKAYMVEKEDVKGSVENLNHGKETVLESLKESLKRTRLKKETVELLIQAVEKIKIEAKENIITADVDIPQDLLKSVTELIQLLGP